MNLEPRWSSWPLWLEGLASVSVANALLDDGGISLRFFGQTLTTWRQVVPSASRQRNNLAHLELLAEQVEQFFNAAILVPELPDGPAA